MVITTILFVSQLLELIIDPAKRFVDIRQARQMDRNILLFLIGLWMNLSAPEIKPTDAPLIIREGTVHDLVDPTDGSHIDDFTPVLFIEPIKQAEISCPGVQRTQILLQKLLLIPNNACDTESTVELTDGSKYSYRPDQFGIKNALYIQFRHELKSIAAIKLKFNAGDVTKMGYQTKNIDTEFRVTTYEDSIRIELHNDIQSISVNRGDEDLFKVYLDSLFRSGPKSPNSKFKRNNDKVVTLHGEDSPYSNLGDTFPLHHNLLCSNKSNILTIKRWDNEKVPSVFMVLSDGFSFFPVEVSMPSK